MAVQIAQGTKILQDQKDLKIDLGCGPFKNLGFVGFDIQYYPDAAPGHEPDFLCNIDEGIPLEDNSVIEVYASHFLEHISTWDSFFTELHRVCQPGAKVEIRVPYLQHCHAFSLGHIRVISEHMFHDNVLFRRLFEIMTVERVYDAAVLEIARIYFPNISPEDMAKLFWNIVKELHVTCTPIKEVLQ